MLDPCLGEGAQPRRRLLGRALRAVPLGDLREVLIVLAAQPSDGALMRLLAQLADAGELVELPMEAREVPALPLRYFRNRPLRLSDRPA